MDLLDMKAPPRTLTLSEQPLDSLETEQTPSPPAQVSLHHSWHISTGGCGSVQSVKVRDGSRFHCQKVGVTRTEPHRAVLVLQYSSV